MKETVFLGHLGLGDHLVCNALVRELAKDSKIIVLAKEHNVESCRFMWRDNPKIEVFGVADSPNDAQIREACFMLEGHGVKTLRLGCHRKEPFDVNKWDREFYRQAGVDFKLCWDNFKVDQQPSRELVLIRKGKAVEAAFPPQAPWVGRYIFVHDDAARGHHINPARLPKGNQAPKIVRATPIASIPGVPANIFDWWGIIAGAEEIHCMESSFAILVDHLPELKAKRRVLHKYCRKSIPPTYATTWERIE